MSRPVRHAALGALLATLLAAPTARANPSEMIGFGTHGIGMGNAMVASTDVLTAPVYNPAGGVLGDGSYVLGAGYTYNGLRIDVNDQDPGTLNPHGFYFAGMIPFDLGRAHFAFGMNIYMPDQFILRAHSVPPTTPRLVMWDNRPHRVVADVTMSARITEWLSIGAGVSLLGGIKGREIVFTLDADPAATRADATIVVDFPILITPLIGVIVQPIPELRLGARFRDEEGLDVVVNVLADISVPGTAVDGNVLLNIVGPSGYTPRELTFGGSYDLGNLTLSAEVGWLQWSRVTQVAAGIAVEADLGVDVPTGTFVEPPPNFRNTWVPRVGAEYGFDIDAHRRLTARAGYYYSPTPVPAQTGETNFADGNRHVVSVGGTYDFVLLEQRLGLELAFSVHQMPRREMIKTNPTSPGGDLTVGGQIYTVSAGLRVSL